MLAALYPLLTLAFAGVLLALLLRPGAARAGALWGLAALLPLLAACAAALTGQSRAARVLAGWDARPVTVSVGGATSRRLTLSPGDAACVERALRLHTRSDLLTPQGPVPLNGELSVTGDLPPQAVVEALEVRGALNCPNLRPRREEGEGRGERG